MKESTLKTKIKDLPTTGNFCCLIRQLAGVSGQKYRDAHRCRANAAEGDCVDQNHANRTISSGKRSKPSARSTVK